MADVAVISVDIERTKAISGSKAIKRELETLRKSVRGLSSDLTKLNKALGRSGSGLGKKAKEAQTEIGKLKQKITSVDRAAKKGKNSIQKFTGRMTELSKSTQLALGPLSGIAARITALSSLVKGSNLIMVGFIVTMVALGAAFFKGTKLLIAFEDAMRDVAKNTGRTGKALTILSTEIRRLAPQFGIAAEELAGIASVAAQLGIKGNKDLLTFTKTIAQLTRATNLTGREGALNLARLLNVTNEGIKRLPVLASVIADLGANSAALETEILAAGTAVARVTAIFGISSTDAIALGTAMASLGVKAEAGATAIGRVFAQIQETLGETGRRAKNLEILFGLPISKIKKLFEEDALKALQLFILGLKRVDDAGVSATSVLKDFGLASVRESKTILALANNIQKLFDTIDRKTREEKTPDALTKQFTIRQASLQRRLDQFVETMKELGRVLGSLIFPILSDFIDNLTIGTARFTAAIQGLKVSVKDVMAVLRVIGSSPLFAPFLAGTDLLSASNRRFGIASAPTVGPSVGPLLPGQAPGIGPAIGPLLPGQIRPEAFKKLADESNKVGRAFLEAAGASDLFTEGLANAGEGANRLVTGPLEKFLIKIGELRVKLAELASGNISDPLLAGDRIRAARLLKGVETVADTEKAIAAVNDLANAFGIVVIKGENAEDTLTRVFTVVREGEKAAKLMQQRFDRAFKSIITGFERALFQMFRGTKNRNIIGEFVDFIKDAFANLFAQLIAASVTQSFLAPIFANLATNFLGADPNRVEKAIQNVTGNADFTVAQTATGGGGLAGAASAFGDVVDELGALLGVGTRGLDPEGNEIIIGGLTKKAQDTFGKVFEGAAIGSLLFGAKSLPALIGAGIGAALGEKVGKALAGTFGKLGKNLGDVLGQKFGDSLGKFFGKIAGPLGEILGSAIGAKLGNLIAKKPKASVFLGASGGQAIVADIVKGRKNSSPVEEVTAIGQIIVDTFNSIAEALGTSISDAIDLRFKIKLGKESPFRVTIAGVTKFFTSQVEAIGDAIKRGILEGNIFKDVPQAVLTVLRRTAAITPQDILKEVEFAIDFSKGFGVFDAILTDLAKQLKALDDKFRIAADRAQQLGLSVRAVDLAKDINFQGLKLDFNKDIRLLLLDIINPVEAELLRQAEIGQQRLDDAALIGADIAAIEKLNMLERQKIVERFGAETTNILEQFLVDITATPQSRLPLATSLANAQSRFSMLRGQFLAGDVGLSTDLINASRDLLELTGRREATGPGFFSTQTLVEDTIRAALEIQNASINEIDLLTDLNFAIESGNQQRDEMIDLLRQLVEGPGDDTTPFIGLPGGRVGTSGTGGGGSGVATFEGGGSISPRFNRER